MSTSNGNPFKEIRLKNHLSQYELARLAKVSKHAVLRLEQGMYESPLPTLVNYYVDRFAVNRAELINAYGSYQKTTRESSGRFLGDLSPTPVGEHPLTFLRERAGLNPTEVAKRLCISQSAIVYFEKRSIHQHTVPSQLVFALRDAGYTADEVAALSKAYTQYRNFLISKQNVTVGTVKGVA